MKKLVIISGGLGVMGQSFAGALTEDGYDVLLLDVREAAAGESIIGESLDFGSSKPAYIILNVVRLYAFP